MVRHGDGNKIVWATEMGWIINATCHGHTEYVNDPLWAAGEWQRVSPQTQAGLPRLTELALEGGPHPHEGHLGGVMLGALIGARRPALMVCKERSHAPGLCRRAPG